MDPEPFQRDQAINLPAKRAAIEVKVRRIKQWMGAIIVCAVFGFWLDMQGSSKKETREIAIIFLGLYALSLSLILGLGVWVLWLRSRLNEIDWQIEADKRARASLGDIFKRE